MQKQTFSQYVSLKRDADELLLYVLGTLVREENAFQQLRNDRQVLTSISIPISDFETRVRLRAHLWCPDPSPQAQLTPRSSALVGGVQAREYRIHDTRAFYRSPLFTANRYVLDEARKVITLPL